jgi:uncharacterized membrane protein HdeD (DUF308 family)
MNRSLGTQVWSSFVLRGAVALLLGVLAIASPNVALSAALFVFAAYAVVDGVIAVVAGIALPVGRWLLIIGGLAAIAVGVYTFANPGTTAVALVILIGSFAVVRGIAEVGAAIALRTAVPNALLLGVAGVASILFGVLVIAAPGDGALAITWAIGIYALFVGAMDIAFGLRVRSTLKTVQSSTGPETTSSTAATAS